MRPIACVFIIFAGLCAAAPLGAREAVYRVIEAGGETEAFDPATNSWSPVNERTLLAQLEHRRWNGERRLAGWTRGPKNPVTRTNPNLVEWEKLPTNMRAYDFDAVDAIPMICREAWNHKLVRTRPQLGSHADASRQGPQPC